MGFTQTFFPISKYLPTRPNTNALVRKNAGKPGPGRRILFAFVIVLIVATQQVSDHRAFFEDFSSPTLTHFRYGSTGTSSPFKWQVGVRSSSEPGNYILSFKLDPEDSAGAGRGPEIISRDSTHFGSYSTRLKVPDVRGTQPDVGAVVGYFTYHNEPRRGLSEIDFEWLLADPEIIYVGTWTGQQGALQRIGRIINLAEGTILSTTSRVGHDGQRSPLSGAQNQPDSLPAIKNFDASSQFYTYGFDWYPDRLRWWMIHPTTADTVVLWDYQGSTVGIPQHPSYYRMNFWHTDNWAVETNPNSREKPRYPYELEIDWIAYDPLKK